MPIDTVTLESALKLLELPRLVGTHPETGEKIEAGIGRFGPFLKHQNKFKSIPKGDDVLSIGMNRAVELLAQESKGNWRTRRKEEAEKAKAEGKEVPDPKAKTKTKPAAKKKTAAKKKPAAKKKA